MLFTHGWLPVASVLLFFAYMFKRDPGVLLSFLVKSLILVSRVMLTLKEVYKCSRLSCFSEKFVTIGIISVFRFLLLVWPSMCKMYHVSRFHCSVESVGSHGHTTARLQSCFLFPDSNPPPCSYLSPLEG